MAAKKQKATLESLRAEAEAARDKWLADIDRERMAGSILRDLDDGFQSLVWRKLGVSTKYGDFRLSDNSPLHPALDEAAARVRSKIVVPRIEEAMKRVKIPLATLKEAAENAVVEALRVIVRQKAVEAAELRYDEMRESLGLTALDGEDKFLKQCAGEAADEAFLDVVGRDDE